RSPPRSRACACACTRCRSATRDATTQRARRSARATVCSRSARSSAGGCSARAVARAAGAREPGEQQREYERRSRPRGSAEARGEVDPGEVVEVAPALPARRDDVVAFEVEHLAHGEALVARAQPVLEDAPVDPRRREARVELGTDEALVVLREL